MPTLKTFILDLKEDNLKIKTWLSKKKKKKSGLAVLAFSPVRH